MEIIVQNTKENYYKFINYYCFQRKLPLRLLGIVVLSLFFSGQKNIFYTSTSFIIFVTFVLILSAIIFLIPYLIQIGKLKKIIKTKSDLFEKTKITVVASGICFEENNNKSLFKWEDIKFVEKNRDCIFISFRNKYFTSVIPIMSFQTKSDSQIFYDKVIVELLKVQGLSRLKSGKHLYYWGLLGLVPNIGLITGIILLYKGIFSYKDRKLILIGFADILFTIVFWAVFKYQMSHGKLFADSNVSLAEMQLDHIVKDIELYKVKNGFYPDNLNQIEPYEKDFSIHDPFLPLESDNEGNFNYKRVGMGYILFSVGLDRIPNTKDDIYPPITKVTN